VDVTIPHTVEDEFHDERRHQAALGVVHVIAITEPALRLLTHTVLTLGITLGDQVRSKVLGKVLSDQSRLCEDNLLSPRCLDADNGGFAEGVNLLELGVRSLLEALVGLDFVVNLAFFEKPDDALGSRLLQPMCESVPYPGATG